MSLWAPLFTIARKRSCLVFDWMDQGAPELGRDLLRKQARSNVVAVGVFTRLHCCLDRRLFNLFACWCSQLRV